MKNNLTEKCIRYVECVNDVNRELWKVLFKMGFEKIQYEYDNHGIINYIDENTGGGERVRIVAKAIPYNINRALGYTGFDVSYDTLSLEKDKMFLDVLNKKYKELRFSIDIKLKNTKSSEIIKECTKQLNELNSVMLKYDCESTIYDSRITDLYCTISKICKSIVENMNDNEYVDYAIKNHISNIDLSCSYDSYNSINVSCKGGEYSNSINIGLENPEEELTEHSLYFKIESAYLEVLLKNIRYHKDVYCKALDKLEKADSYIQEKIVTNVANALF